MTLESKEVPMKRVLVGFYWHTDNEGLEERIKEIKKFLLSYGGTCDVLRKSVSKRNSNLEIEFRAIIPASFANAHHKFDSKLNSTKPGDFGVGWVSEW